MGGGEGGGGGGAGGGNKRNRCLMFSAPPCCAVVHADGLPTAPWCFHFFNNDSSQASCPGNVYTFSN